MLLRNKKYRYKLYKLLFVRVCTVVLHLSLLILLNGHFNFSYGEVVKWMSIHPLIDSETTVKDETHSSHPEKFPKFNVVSSEKSGQGFFEKSTSRNIPTTQNNSSGQSKDPKFPTMQSVPEKQNFSSLDSEESVYLAVYLNKRMLTEVIEAKEKNGSIYVKLNEMAILLNSTPPKDVNAISTLAALENMYPAIFEYSKKYQALFIKGNGELPIEKKWERERLQKYLSSNSINSDAQIVNFEYGLLGPPSIDFSANYVRNGVENYGYSFKSGMEALFGTVSIVGLGDKSDSLTDLRVQWERFNSNWFIQLGDVFAPPIDLVSQAEAGLGINFSTFPIENSTQFDTDTITGDLLEGWEVELYRGNTLLDFRRSDGSGRFIFRDIPLLFGENNIILKFYGPQGQIRQESRLVNIGRGMAPVGKLWTRLSFIDQGENLFFGRYSQTRNNIEGFRGFGQAFYGLTKRLTLTGSLTSYKTKTLGTTMLGKAGFLSSFIGSSLKIDFLADDKDGYGFESAFLTRLMDWGVQYRHVEFFDLRTDQEPNLKTRRTLRINRGFRDVFLELSAEQNVDRFDVTRYRYEGRISGKVGLVSLTNDIEANFGGNTEFTRGNFLTNARVHPKLLLRTNINYEVHPELEVRTVQGTLDYNPKNDITLRLNVIKNFIGNKNYIISQSLLWNGEKIGLGITGAYSESQDFQVNASVTFSLSQDSSGGYQMKRTPSTNMGTVNVRVFLDHDQNGKYDSEIDELLEKVRLKNRSGESSNYGMIAFKGPAYRLAYIKIDENSLPDPFMEASSAVAVRPRPTHINTLNLPVWETGEIEGQAEPGELIELVEGGKVIASTHAEYDGFFLFEKVRFKTYEIRTHEKLEKVEVNRMHPITRVKWKGYYKVVKN